MRNNTPLESAEQVALFRWAAYASGTHPELKNLYHVPNGGTRDRREAHNLRLQGVKSGVPDICLDWPGSGYHGLRIELKRTKGGRLSDDQKDWLERLNRAGYRAVVCYGWDEARREIEEYLGGHFDDG